MKLVESALLQNDDYCCVAVYKQKGETNDVDHDGLKIKKEKKKKTCGRERKMWRIIKK